VSATARRCGRGLAGGNVDVGDDDLGALLREALGGGAADAAATAGNEGHLARHARHVDPLSGDFGFTAAVMNPHLN
jgi:hypothetical protein